MDTSMLVLLFILVAIFGMIGFFVWKEIRQSRINKQIAKQEKEDRAKLVTSLKEKINHISSSLPFYPDAYFYAQYHKNHVDGLHYMAATLFDWLKINPDGCVVNFYDHKDFPSGATDTAGFYTKIKDDSGAVHEIILINKKHESDSFAVGAILAHEMMHLYLYRLGIEDPDRLGNELMTDLATIKTGLSILILNGFSYSNSFFITIALLFVGVLHWSEQQQSFGYFKPYEYGRESVEYFKNIGIGVEKILGYMNPTARRYIPHARFHWTKSETEYIKVLDKRHVILLVAQILIVCTIAGYWIISAYTDNKNSNYKQELKIQIDSCKAQINTQEAVVVAEQQRLDNMQKQMSEFKNIGNVGSYNSMVDDYNELLENQKNDFQNYEDALNSCNQLVNKYNSIN